MKHSLFSIVALLLIASLVLTACGATPTTEPTSAPEQPTQAPAATEPSTPTTQVDFAVMSGGYLEKALNGDYSGTTVTVDGPFTNPDDVRFAESMKAFEDATGITVKYIGDKEFESRISVSVDAGNPPDIADFPQPGTVATFARQGHIVDPTSWISEDWLKQQYNQSWLDMGTVTGPDGSPMTGARASSGIPRPSLMRQATPSPPPGTSCWPSPSRSPTTATLPGASASSRRLPPAGPPPTGPRT